LDILGVYLLLLAFAGARKAQRPDAARGAFSQSNCFAVMINLLDSHWIVLTPSGWLYLIVVAESVRYSYPGEAPSPRPPQRSDSSGLDRDRGASSAAGNP